MKVIKRLLAQKRLIWSVAVMWVIAGVMAWQSMPRQEDPNMPDIWGMIIAPFPGADAKTVERLVVDPIEEKLMEVDGIKSVTSVSRSDAAILNIELTDDVTDHQSVWDEIRRALDAIEKDLPEEAERPTLDEKINDQESVVLAITGSDDRLLLKTNAETLKTSLLREKSVAKIKLIADPGEQITVAADDATLRRLGIDFSTLVSRLRAQNRLIPGGSIKVGEKEVSLRPGSDFRSIDEIRNTPVLLPSGASVPLSTVTQISRTETQPASERMWHNGKTAIGLGVIPKAGIDQVAFGVSVQRAVKAFNKQIAPLRAEVVVNQPANVAMRINQLTDALMVSIVFVALILVLSMGVRLGVSVAVIIPMVVLAGLAVFGFFGGALHQISIAAVVISLGMLVDNAIVVTEGIQAKIDEGISSREAAQQTVSELIFPLGAATGTTIAAFIPMLLAQGPTAEFTKTIPIVIILTLIASYIFAVTVTPLLARAVLKPQKSKVQSPSETYGIASRLAGVAVRRKWIILAFAAVVVGLSLLGSGYVSKRFFPNSDRALMVVKVTLPEGSHLDATSGAVTLLQEKLRGQPGVVSVSAFAGRSVPHFYYNLPYAPNSPGLGQLVVQTERVADLAPVARWIRETGQRRIPQADLVVSPLEQGPPVAAPIAIRLFSDDLAKLEQAVLKVRNLLLEAPGAKDVRHGLGVGAPMVDFEVQENTAGRLGISRADVALSLYRTTRGLSLGPLRSGSDPVPILFRATAGEATPMDALMGVDAAAPGKTSVPMAQITLPSVRWMPAALHHRDRQRMTTVTANLKKGAAFSDVMGRIAPKMDTLDLESLGVTYTYGGDMEGSEEANGAMMAALPIGMILLLAILLMEFPSFRKVGIILITVPLAAAGVIPGLLISAQPFGFMSLLGVFALVGVVVNNAIVLLDLVNRLESEGVPRITAVKRAVERRVRPILLTTMTTIIGLIPLAISPTTLWPPLAFAMISGLAVSTMLTILVVPALYLILFRDNVPVPIPT